MKLSVYDMDKTVTRKPSWMAWLLFFARTETPLRLLLLPLLSFPAIGYAFGLLDRKGLKECTQGLLMGRRVGRARVERAAAAFAERFGARMELAGALAAIEADRAAGHDVWLATASCRYFAEALARRWGIDQLVATENIWDGDFLTNRIRGENCYGMGKLRMLLARLAARPELLRFTSDHESDLPALWWADQPVAANPSPPLRAVAGAQKWEIRDWC